MWGRAALRRAAFAAWLALPTSALAATIDVVGLFPNKAVVALDHAAPRAMSVGETVGGVKLVAVDASGATFVVDGRRQTIALGSYFAPRSDNDRASAVLPADSGGHFLAQGSINATPPASSSIRARRS